jgi:SOS response regulatory protein OraA/RecX
LLGGTSQRPSLALRAFADQDSSRAELALASHLSRPCIGRENEAAKALHLLNQANWFSDYDPITCFVQLKLAIGPIKILQFPE